MEGCLCYRCLKNPAPVGLWLCQECQHRIEREHADVRASLDAARKEPTDGPECDRN